MKTIREQFEKIWPVPDGVCWAEGYGEYMPMNRHSMKHSELACEWDTRLDTFTRCQETQTEIERALAGMLFAFDDGVGREWSEDLLDYARKLVAAKEYVK